ncbi:MAG: sigma-70 family RNA polymerase sigma factor [Alphaproteobacteria bacterium]|jgi:RNA polymerase sigma-70 factor (ECF subfamily)
MSETGEIEKLEAELRTYVLQTRQGNARSYQKLLADLLPFVRRGVAGQMHRYGKGHLSEDVTQEVMLAVHVHLHTYDSDLPFLAWVRAVMKHKAIDNLRRHKVTMVSMDDMTDSVMPSVPPQSEQRMIERDLSFLLAALKPPTGEIIHALKVEGVSIRDLAQKFGMSESNIKVLVHRGIKKMSRMVTEGEPDDKG